MGSIHFISVKLGLVQLNSVRNKIGKLKAVTIYFVIFFFFFLAKPTTPSGITHSSLTNTSFSVSWTAPASDFAIKDYKAVIRTKADNNVVETKLGLTTTSTTFSGLNVFTEYIVEISAQSSLNVFSNAGTLEVKTDEGGIKSVK